MYQDSFNNNSAKKRMLQNWTMKFEQDKSNPTVNSALTMGDAKTFESLLDITEEIETQSQLLLSDFDKSQIETGQVRIDARSNEIISRLYRDVRKGNQLLVKTNFKGLPRTDIASLAKYADSVEKYYDIFVDIQGTIIHETEPRVPANPDIDQAVDDIEAEMEDINRRIFAVTTEQKQYEMDNPLRMENGVLKSMGERNDIKRQLGMFDTALVGLRERLRELERNLPRMQHLKERRADEVRDERIKVIKRKSSDIDFKLILKNYKVFVDTLKNGLLAYNAGLSGKINKMGETLTASGLPMRRFL